jgi:cyclopropane-fatty-acyl-phospholipid synthase
MDLLRPHIITALDTIEKTGLRIVSETTPVVYRCLFEQFLLPAIASGIEKGKLVIKNEAGRILLEKGEGKPCGIMVIRDEVRFTHALLSRGEIGLGESYTSEVWYAGEESLESLLLLFVLNERRKEGLGRHRLALKTWSFGTDSENIRHHYDAPGNDFFKLFLTDPYQAYSCGFFKSEGDTLDIAQERKVKYIVRKLGLQNRTGARVLDVGCGWGYIMNTISKKTGCMITGVTLSENQKNSIETDLCTRNPNVRALLVPFVDMEEPVSLEEDGYDAIYSIGMFEHVRHENYEAFFRKVSRLLKPEGRLVLHTIIDARDRHDSPPYTTIKNDTFVTTHIFPGGQIAHRSWIDEAVDKTDLKIHHTELFGGQHYARTLSEWAMRLQWAKDHIEEVYGKKQYLLYEYYMRMCQASFTAGNMQLAHYVMSKGDVLSVEKGFVYE